MGSTKWTELRPNMPSGNSNAALFAQPDWLRAVSRDLWADQVKDQLRKGSLSQSLVSIEQDTRKAEQEQRQSTGIIF